MGSEPLSKAIKCYFKFDDLENITYVQGDASGDEALTEHLQMRTWVEIPNLAPAPSHKHTQNRCKSAIPAGQEAETGESLKAFKAVTMATEAKNKTLCLRQGKRQGSTLKVVLWSPDSEK